MRGRLEPKDTVERFWGLKFIGFPNLSDETPKPARNSSPFCIFYNKALNFCNNCRNINKDFEYP